MTNAIDDENRLVTDLNIMAIFKEWKKIVEMLLPFLLQ